MKNLLIAILSILSTVLIIFLVFRGVSMGDISILSITQIKENSEKLDADIETLSALKDTTYKNELSNLETSIKNLTVNKNKYLEVASTSSEAEIQQANQQRVYSMEYLWNKVGSYATSNGVNLKWDVTQTDTSGKYKLSFSLTGSYIGILNYVYSLENDSDLSFKIDNFKIVSGSSEESLNATFTVTNIGIKQENVTSK